MAPARLWELCERERRHVRMSASLRLHVPQPNTSRGIRSGAVQGERLACFTGLSGVRRGPVAKCGGTGQLSPFPWCAGSTLFKHMSVANRHYAARSQEALGLSLPPPDSSGLRQSIHFDCAV